DNQDDCHHDQQLNQRKALLVLSHVLSFKAVPKTLQLATAGSEAPGTRGELAPGFPVGWLLGELVVTPNA
ncbi:MAG: hypothetical protein WBD54_12575, partial [Candidatus Acidiferrales bacterium]